METLKKIGDFFWKNKSFVLFVLVIILVILNLKQCSDGAYQEKINNQNNVALNEKMRTIELNNKQILSDRAIYFGSLEDIKKANKDLYNEMVLLKKNGYKTEIINKIEYVYIDSGKVQNKLSHIKGDEYSLDFNYLDKDSIISIKGKSKFRANSYIKEVLSNGKNVLGVNIKPDSTIFDNITFNSGLIVGVGTDKDGIERVTAKPFPYTDKIKIINIETVGLEEYFKRKYAPKTKRFGIGPTAGYGVMYNVGNGQFGHGPYIGISINWNLIKF